MNKKTLTSHLMLLLLFVFPCNLLAGKKSKPKPDRYRVAKIVAGVGVTGLSLFGAWRSIRHEKNLRSKLKGLLQEDFSSEIERELARKILSDEIARASRDKIICFGLAGAGGIFTVYQIVAALKKQDDKKDDDTSGPPAADVTPSGGTPPGGPSSGHSSSGGPDRAIECGRFTVLSRDYCEQREDANGYPNEFFQNDSHQSILVSEQGTGRKMQIVIRGRSASSDNGVKKVSEYLTGGVLSDMPEGDSFRSIAQQMIKMKIFNPPLDQGGQIPMVYVADENGNWDRQIIF